MGATFGAFINPGNAAKEGTTLKELRIDHIRDAHDIIGQRPNDLFTPVVLVPSSSFSTCCCIPCCFLQVPEGFSAIVLTFGAAIDGDAEDKTFSPGCHQKCCCFSNVDKLVSKQLIIFDTPVKDCKTKDSISVQIDVLIVFEIVRAKDFVYAIGPERFDDFLRASQEESLRQMANETLVEDIYDLCSAKTDHIVTDLNAKFEKYGVSVHFFTVKDVKIPREMAKDMEDKTLFDTKDRMNVMKQKFDQQTVNNAEGKQKLQEECANKRMAAEQNAEVTKNKAIKETSTTIARTEKDIAELEASKDVEVKLVLTEVEFTAAEQKAKILVLEREMKSKTASELGRMEAEAQSYAKQKVADAEVEVAQKLANGKRALGEAEGESSSAFAARRAHEAEMARLNILEQLISNPNVQIATSQENTIGMNPENAVVTQMTQQGLEAMRAKLAEITATSLAKLESQPRQQAMR